MRILKEGGLILADNALWYGRIFDPQDEDSKAMALFNEGVNADDRAEKLFLICQIIGADVFIHCILDGRRNVPEILQQRNLR